MGDSTRPALRLGMFVMPIHDPAKSLVQCVDEDLELAVQCDRLGFDEFWVGEHHTSAIENIVMPEIFIAKAVAMTKRMRFGPAPVCLQYHHPVHVANRLAFLDHLSHGRLNVCFGPGSIPTDIEVYGVAPQEIAARVGESVEMILKIWTSEPPFEFAGKFWNVSLKRQLDPEMGLTGLHKPLQRPYPPIAVPSVSPRSVGIEKAAAQGFSLFSHHMIRPRRRPAVVDLPFGRGAGRPPRNACRLARRPEYLRRRHDGRSAASGPHEFARPLHSVHPRSHPPRTRCGDVETQCQPNRRRLQPRLFSRRGANRRRPARSDSATARYARKSATSPRWFSSRTTGTTAPAGCTASNSSPEKFCRR